MQYFPYLLSHVIVFFKEHLRGPSLWGIYCEKCYQHTHFFALLDRNVFCASCLNEAKLGAVGVWDCQSVSSVAQSCPTLYDPMNHSTPGFPCPSPTPRVYSNSCPLSRWCHPAISSSVISFSSCPQPLPTSGSFPTNQLFTCDETVQDFKGSIIINFGQCVESQQQQFRSQDDLSKHSIQVLFLPSLNWVHTWLF